MSTAIPVGRTLGKWVLWLAAGLLALVSLVAGGQWVREYIANRPFQAKRYADLSLGDSQDEVVYAKGPPKYIMEPPAPEKASDSKENPWERYRNPPSMKDYVESVEWFYSLPRARIEVTFDRPKGNVSSVACFSDGIMDCPSIFGIYDGASEDRVVSHLGQPGSTTIIEGTKILRYPNFNLQIHLERRRVTGLKVVSGPTS